MTPADLIAEVAAGRALPDADLRAFVAGIASGAVTDAQAGAFAMAVMLRGLDAAGQVALTIGMRDSGRVLEWDLPGPVIDKHSTGGIGDCVSLVLAPALAACGAYVPMISGRGLGFSGGTLDKLEAIPGFRVQMDEVQLRRQVAGIGCAIVAASPEIAPADRRLYAIRDVTATVSSIALIAGSVMSKKLAAGLQALVLDVKVGSGAFMKTMGQARELARTMVDIGNGAGCRTMATITDMSQPLAPAAGNALEVIEAMEVLTGDAPGRLRDLTVAFGGRALALGGLAVDEAEGAARIAAVLSSGAAAEVFGRMVAAQRGPADFPDRWRDRLPVASVVQLVRATGPGIVAAIDGEALGHAVVALGGGRRRETDRINPAVGLSRLAGIGTQVATGDPLAVVHASTAAAAEAAATAVSAAYTVRDSLAEAPPLIFERIG